MNFTKQVLHNFWQQTNISIIPLILSTILLIIVFCYFHLFVLLNTEGIMFVVLGFVVFTLLYFVSGLIGSCIQCSHNKLIEDAGLLVSKIKNTGKNLTEKAFFWKIPCYVAKLILKYLTTIIIAYIILHTAFTTVSYLPYEFMNGLDPNYTFIGLFYVSISSIPASVYIVLFSRNKLSIHPYFIHTIIFYWLYGEPFKDYGDTIMFEAIVFVTYLLLMQSIVLLSIYFLKRYMDAIVNRKTIHNLTNYPNTVISCLTRDRAN